MGPDEWSLVDPDGRSFLDVDTPDDLTRLERAATTVDRRDPQG